MADLGVLDDVVNGPEDVPDWDAIGWRRQRGATYGGYGSGSSRRRRQGTWRQVRNLQKLTAPRGALSYPRRSREELEGRFLGLMANLDPKW